MAGAASIFLLDYGHLLIFFLDRDPKGVIKWSGGDKMIAKREVWNYPQAVKVWVGKYKNSHNLLHWHYDCELLYVERGCIDVFCEKRTHTLMNDDLLYVDSGKVHYMQARDPETVLIVIIFDFDILKPYIGDVKLASPRVTGKYPIPAIYRELRDILLKKEPFYGGEAAGKIISLMSSIFRNEPLAPRAAADGTAKRFMELLEDIGNKFEFYTFEDAVAFMGMSEAYFSRYFKRATGTTFSQYLNYVRTENAISMLAEKDLHTMTEIAGACGFGTIRNFNRIFKAMTGFSPSNLPGNYVLSDKFVYPSDNAFNPTLFDCELLESANTN